MITHSLLVLRELGGDLQITLIATGGTVRPATFSLVGPLAEEMISRFHADRLFLAAAAVDLDRGLYNSYVYEIGVKQHMIHASHEVILLADHTKFGRQSTVKIADLDVLSSVITDSQVPDEIAMGLRRRQIDVRLASAGSSGEATAAPGASTTP